MNTMNPKVDFFFNKASKWQDAYEKLRPIVLDCGLTEELKRVNLVTHFRRVTSF